MDEQDIHSFLTTLYPFLYEYANADDETKQKLLPLNRQENSLSSLDHRQIPRKEYDEHGNEYDPDEQNEDDEYFRFKPTFGPLTLNNHKPIFDCEINAKMLSDEYGIVLPPLEKEIIFDVDTDRSVNLSNCSGDTDYNVKCNVCDGLADSLGWTDTKDLTYTEVIDKYRNIIFHDYITNDKLRQFDELIGAHIDIFHETLTTILSLELFPPGVLICPIIDLICSYTCYVPSFEQIEVDEKKKWKKIYRRQLKRKGRTLPTTNMKIESDESDNDGDDENEIDDE
jgi:hypothetical protein